MKIILLTFLAFACTTNGSKNKSSCWDLEPIQSAISERYGESSFYIENDTLVLITMLEDVGNSGLVDIIREDLLLSTYNFNSDTLTCFNTIFTGIQNSNLLSWTRNHSLQDLYTLIFRDLYYPEFTSVYRIIASQFNARELNRLDTLISTNFSTENFSDKYFKDSPESFTRLCFRATYYRLGGGGLQYESILYQLKLEFSPNKESFDMILERLAIIEPKFNINEGIPWPAWGDNQDYIREIYEFKKEINKLHK